MWHYKLIPYLPKQMLVSQWRELIAIKRQWEKGTLKHRLVSYVMDYDRAYFRNYVRTVRNEMNNRNIKLNYELLEELISFTNEEDFKCSYDLYYPEHNDRYLVQCLYNLEEKATRNIISKEEWLRIYNKFKDFTDLWKCEL